MEFGRKSARYNNEINAVSTSMAERSLPSTGSEDCPLCWICLDSGGELVFPCKCPRSAHPKCLARWQLQSAGTRKELHCEFCDSDLPDWKQTLTPKCGSKAPAVMNVNFDGRTYSFEVKPGPDGYRLFTEAIRRAFSLSDDSELHITFTCDEPTAPDAGSLLTLQGPGAYDAAVHCASVSAARRLTPTSRATSMTSEMLGGPTTPRSPLGLARSASFPSPSSAFTDGSSLPSLSPEGITSPGAQVDDGAPPASKRRLLGLSRRMRSFLDLLSVRQ